MKFKKKKKKTMSVYNIKRMKLFKINEKHSLHLKIFNIYIYIYKFNVGFFSAKNL
jgi:hypothetical protein